MGKHGGKAPIPPLLWEWGSAGRKCVRRAYPNDRAVEPANPARDADSQFARKRMLSHDMPHRTRRWQFACKSAHAHTGSADRFCKGRHPNGENGEIVSSARGVDNSLASQHMLTQALPTASAKGGTRMARIGKLSVPHAMLTVSLPAGTYSLMMCPPHAPALYAMRSLSCGARARLAEQRRLSAPHETLAASFPESKCSPIPCLPRALSFRTAPSR